MPAPRKKRSPSFPARIYARRQSPAGLQDSTADNLETVGDRLKVYSLQSLLTNKRSPETRATAKLGDVLIPWFEQVVVKPGEKMGAISDIWQAIVPTALQDRCRLVGFSRGTLSVALESAALRAELEAKLRGGLLRQLQTDSRGILFRVKTCVQGAPP